MTHWLAQNGSSRTAPDVDAFNNMNVKLEVKQISQT